MKTIHYFERRNYGTTHEYVVNPNDASCISGLTRQTTINEKVRENITRLTDGMVTFQLVTEPR